MRRTLALTLGLLCFAASSAQSPPETFRFQITGSTLKQPSWIVLLSSDKTGLYWGPEAVRAVDGVTLHVSEATWNRVRAGADAVVEGHCETKLKNVANTGEKDASFQDSGGKTSNCTFNFADDTHLNDATAAFEAIAETMQFGDRLERKRRFDRLGLDAEVDALAEEVKGNRAIEVQNIAPVLKAIAADDRVMDRVRRKAARLLQDAVPDSPR